MGKNRQNRRAKAGFTLTEMLVVLSIIGILAAVVLPSIGKFRMAAYKAGTIYEITQLDAACRQFKMDIGYFPFDNYGGNAQSITQGWNPYSGDWIPYCNVPTLFGFLTINNNLNSASITSTPYNVSGDTAVKGPSSRCLVFFLSTKFSVMQKTYGPYYSFVARQLYDKGTTYTPVSGATTSNNRVIRWQLDGIDVVEGKVVPTPRQVKIFQYFDKFGVYKTNQPTNKNFYVYDAYNGIPPGQAHGGAIQNYMMHNKGEFDIFSYGLDGISAWDDVPGSTTDNQISINALKTDATTRIQYWLGNIGDDVNNWSETFRARRIR